MYALGYEHAKTEGERDIVEAERRRLEAALQHADEVARITQQYSDGLRDYTQDMTQNSVRTTEALVNYVQRLRDDAVCIPDNDGLLLWNGENRNAVGADTGAGRDVDTVP